MAATIVDKQNAVAVVAVVVASFIDLLSSCYVLDISNKEHVIINLKVEKQNVSGSTKKAICILRCVCIETFGSTISVFNAFSVYVFDQNELRYLRLLCVNERITCTHFAYMISMFGTNNTHSQSQKKNFTDTQTKTECGNKTHKHVAAVASCMLLCIKNMLFHQLNLFFSLFHDVFRFVLNIHFYAYYMATFYDIASYY